MLTTGREVDRVIIILVILVLLGMFIYLQRCNNVTNKRISSRDRHSTQRLDYFATQLADTHRSVRSMEQKPSVPVEVKDDNVLPAPVSPGFLSAAVAQ